MARSVGKEAEELVQERLAARYAESVSLILFPEGLFVVPRDEGTFQTEIGHEDDEAKASRPC